ncbi:phospholipase D-like domain-containing protein [Methanolobus bombayensis]|uniref:phospholipase D-like domain-containing protein n=1 Tax=Methanolobus bombayensis TaxID=38023 RepID=UPI001AEA7910|nr:phospholipase D-like domain-containing protein [Methanolobus bombayensis]MBP1910330.1 cardiolipin synthase [Methanolobus bombayensis]
MKAEIVPVATGEKWVGSGVRSFKSVIRELISTASNELVMTVYVLTSSDIVNDLQKALERGISVEIYLYAEGIEKENDKVQTIIRLQDEYEYLHIYKIQNDMLHAKVLVADGVKVISGSANFTLSGMTKNYELGFLVSDPDIAMKILTLIKRLKSK